MLDLKYFRENAGAVRAGIARKKFEVDFERVVELDGRRRAITREAEQARAAQKAANAEMAALDKKSPAFQAKVAEMRGLAQEVKRLQAEQSEVEATWETVWLTVPNVPHESVPDGASEEDNVVVHRWGDPEAVSPMAVAHYDVPWFSHYIDLERGTKITGAGFPVFRGAMARLVRSLVQFFLDQNSAAGFEEMHPPFMVNGNSALATGQLPDKEGQMYTVPQDGFYLIPTAEVPVTNFYRDEIFDEKALPVRACAYSPCFRREAGSYGKEVRGLNRVHQFDKVELVEWVHPLRGLDELEALRQHIESLIEQLNLPYRTLLMCSKDIGFPHAKQYDMEVWSGGQKRWLEVSSASWFGDFQARRAQIRFRDGDGRVAPVHTLNGSGLALPRILAALIENNLQADGSVRLPAALASYFGAAALPPPA